jgi:hypothetical protein
MTGKLFSLRGGRELMHGVSDSPENEKTNYSTSRWCVNRSGRYKNERDKRPSDLFACYPLGVFFRRNGAGLVAVVVINFEASRRFHHACARRYRSIEIGLTPLLFSAR